MRPAKNFELMLDGQAGRSLLMMNQDIHQNIQLLDRKKMAAMNREIGEYLRRASNRRLTLQRDLDNTQFKPRSKVQYRKYFKNRMSEATIRKIVNNRRFDYHGKGRGADASYAGSGSYYKYGTLGGRPYAEKVSHSWNGRYGRLLGDDMLLGFRDRKHLKTQVKQSTGMMEIATGYAGYAGDIASWHNEGRVGTDNQRRPERNWFGLSASDRKQIGWIIQKYLSSQR